eukprot:COSAG01_NODE_616_length_14815_cov_8.518076_3_plen_90_part_00
MTRPCPNVGGCHGAFPPVPTPPGATGNNSLADNLFLSSTSLLAAAALSHPSTARGATVSPPCTPALPRNWCRCVPCPRADCAARAAARL